MLVLVVVLLVLLLLPQVAEVAELLLEVAFDGFDQRRLLFLERRGVHFILQLL